jgi:L-cysteate sulfo-lyase
MGSRVDWVVVASGSGGTQAGLLVGLRALGADTRVIGVGVSGDSQQIRKDLVLSIAEGAAALLGLDAGVDACDVVVDGDHVGPGYGLFDDAVSGAIETVASLEGLMLDPVYTGKAMAGLMDLVAQGKFAKDDSVLFLHTGGAAGLFAYSDVLCSLSREPGFAMRRAGPG